MKQHTEQKFNKLNQHTRGTRTQLENRHAPAHNTAQLSRNAFITLCGVGVIGGVLFGLTFLNLISKNGTWIYNLSVLTAVVGTYGVLIMLLLISRLPIIERSYGHDQLVLWHKKFASVALWLIFAHVFLIVLDGTGGIAGISRWFGTLWEDVLTLEWVFAALVGLILFAVAGFTSWKHARKHLKHQTWWTIHLYMYLAVLFSFLHQIDIGGPFADGAGKALWVICYAVVFGAIVWYRIVIPLWRSHRHKLMVQSVIKENDDVVSVIIRGNHLDELKVEPGQFFQWRFDAPGLAYESHPYSVSGMPHNNHMRISVKNLGDGSNALTTLTPGTRAFIEGPYGATTSNHAKYTSRSILVAGGIGISPIISLAYAISATKPVDLIYRVSSLSEVVFDADLNYLNKLPNVQVHVLPGSRKIYPMDAPMLDLLLGDVHDASAYICGPEKFNEHVKESMLTLGASAQNIHIEHFNW